MNAPFIPDALSASDPGPRHRLDHEPVLIVSGCLGATRRYRCLHQAEQLFLRGIHARVVSPWRQDIVDAGLGCGTVILHRVAWDPTVQMLIDQTRDTGGIVLFDIDDLVFEPDSTHLHRGVAHLPSDEQVLYHDGVRRYRRTLLACDGAIVPAAFLAERVRALGVPTWFSRNCVDLEILERSRSTSGHEAASEDPIRSGSDRVVVGYASGSRTHDHDFAEAAGPAILRIMARRPEVDLRIIGPLQLGAKWEDLLHRVTHVPAVDWRGLPAEISAFDISLAPLELHNPFCEAKSELKWLEASACGIATVASATGAFRHAIEDGVTGMLATDTLSWERAIEALIDDPEKRRRIGSSAADILATQRTTMAQSIGLEQTLSAARTAVRPETQPPAPPRIIDGRPDRGLTISVLVPEPTHGSGGHTTIMRMVGGLEAAGHRVTLLVEPGPHMQTASDRAVEAFMRAHFPETNAAIRFGADIEPCDVAIATGWTTALRVAHAECVRTKLYFVQDFEPYFQPLSADSMAAESTYRLGLGHITIGPWLAETLRDRYGARAEVIDFGVEHDIYFPSAAEATSAQDPHTQRIVFYGRDSTPRRGVALGLEALGRVKTERPDVEIVLYGGDRPGLADFPYVHAGVLSRPDLAALYRSATIGLALSYTNLSLVPVEMSASGLPVVAVDAEPVRWYQKDGETCHVVAPTAEAIAAGIVRLLDDPSLRQRLAAGGLERVAIMTWERATARFAEHVEAYASEQPASSENGIASDHSAAVLAGPALDALAGDPSPEAAALSPQEAISWEIVTNASGLRRIEVRAEVEGLNDPLETAAGDLLLQLLDHPSSPRALATAVVPVHTILEEAWTTFDIQPLAHSAGQRLHLSLLYIPGTSLSPRITLEVDENGIPAHRTWCDPVDFRAVMCSSDIPEIRALLHRRRRSLALRRLRLAQLRRRRVLAATTRLWWRWTRPVPSGPLRPWRNEAPPLQKLMAGLTIYGPIPVVRELFAWLRWRLGARPS